MRIFEQTGIDVNLSTLIDSRMLLCANSGGGKSYAVRTLLEQVGSEVMSIVLDVEGEFKTLREKYDFLLIGETGDVPINTKVAGALPRKLFEVNVSTIIDISDLKRQERVQYVKRFLEGLMELPRKYWRPCLVIVDEAHIYCGQREKQESTHAVIDLMTRGRKRGFCGVLASQRIAKLHKDACAECNNYMVGRTGLDVDMRRAAEILGFATKEDMLSLRNLDPGEFYVFGPAISRQVQKAKVARARTTHPKVGMDVSSKVCPPTQRVKDALSKLTDLPREMEEKAKTVKDLKQKIRELQREISERPSVSPDTKQLEVADKQGYARAKKELEPIVRQVRDLERRLQRIGVLAQVETQTEIQPTRVTVPEKRAIPMRTPARQAQPRLNSGPPSSNLGKCERAILSLLWNNPERQFKKTMVALFTGYSHKSGSFNNAVCKLNAMGVIQRVGECLEVTESGHASGEELLGDAINLHEEFTVDNWAQKLPKCESLIFQFLMENPSTVFSKDEIGEATGYRPGSGSFNNAICRLNSLGLIVRTPDKRIQLNAEILEK